MPRAFQLFQNTDTEKNPVHAEGRSQMTFLGVVDCTASKDGAVGVKCLGVKGLDKNFATLQEFQSACQAAGILAKEYEGSAADVRDEKDAGKVKK